MIPEIEEAIEQDLEIYRLAGLMETFQCYECRDVYDLWHEGYESRSGHWFCSEWCRNSWRRKFRKLHADA